MKLTSFLAEASTTPEGLPIYIWFIPVLVFPGLFFLVRSMRKK